jgi:hypothetical protein
MNKDSEKRCSGAEARSDSAGFMRGLIPTPPSDVRFSAACEGCAFVGLLRRESTRSLIESAPEAGFFTKL